MNVNEIVAEFLNLARHETPQDIKNIKEYEDISIIQDPEYRRLKSNVNMQHALKKYNIFR